MSKEIKSGGTGIEGLKMKVNGHNTHYLKAGSGPPVVLIHGGASDSRDWVNTMDALASRYSLYAPDLIGYGQSDRSQDSYYLSEFSDFIVEFIKALGLENTVLAGHSLGARICLDVAGQHPDKVRKIVLVDAAGLGKVSGFGTVVLTAFWAIRKLLRRPQPYPTILYGEGEDRHLLREDKLPKLGMPTLLVWKRFDVYLPLSIARRAQKLIPGAKLAVLPGYGHAPHKENSEIFNRLLLDFLDHD